MNYRTKALGSCVLVALALGGAFTAYRIWNKPEPAVPDGPQGSPVQGTPVASTMPREPELLLISYRGNQAIFAMDFDRSKALAKELTLEQRQQFIMKECLRFYEKERAGIKKKVEKIRIHALVVPDRDEYAKGSFRNLLELATMDSTPGQLDADGQSVEQRLGAIVWKEGMNRTQ